MESSAAKQQSMAGANVITAEQKYLRTELEQRRTRLHEALHSPGADASLSELLTAVDTPLSRIDQGTFGICATCHDTIEAERRLADTGPELDRMVADANRIFCESTLPGQFATLVVGRAAHDGSVEFVSAGHLPVLHIERDGATPKDSTGVPLGMFCNTRFPVHRLTLAHGDTLFLYTDGLTEARNRAGTEHGLHRIQTLAARHTGIEPAGLISKCLEDLQSFAEGVKQPDDLTLLAVQRAE